MKKNNTKSILLTFLFIGIFNFGYTQNTLQIIKFEEAQEMYNNNKFKQAVSILNELESEGLKNPKILHLKILAKGSMDKKEFTAESFNDLKKDINMYLKNYDIEGLEDKYKEVYQISKTLEKHLIKVEGDKYFNIDNKVALKYYLEAQDAGLQDAEMWWKISDIYQSFIETNSGDKLENKTEAAKWLQKAAEAGNTNACVVLGKNFKNGIDFKKDMEMAMKLFRTAAEKGHPEAQFEMGVGYYTGYLYGWSVSKNMKESLKWFTLAADNPIFHEKSNYELGLVYLSDQLLGSYSPDFGINYPSAKSYLTKIIDQKDIDYKGSYYKARAMIFYVKYFGSTYNGIDLVPEILRIFQEGTATHNSAFAKFYLGLLYNDIFKELKIEKDNQLAINYITEAAKNVSSESELSEIKGSYINDLTSLYNNFGVALRKYRLINKYLE